MGSKSISPHISRSFDRELEGVRIRLERVGDEAQKIAKMAVDLAAKQGPKSYYVGINSMGTHITSVIDAVWCARALERVGDHARNICESVIYFVEGKDVRHISIEDMEKEILKKEEE